MKSSLLRTLECEQGVLKFFTTTRVAERIYDEYSTHTLFTREYVLIHIIYSLHLYNMRTHTHIDTIIEEYISYICYKFQTLTYTPHMFLPLHLIIDKGMYVIYYSTIVD